MSKLVERHIPYSLLFDASDDVVDFGVTFQKERTDSFSVSFYMYGLDFTSTQAILSNRDGAGSTGWEVLYGATNKLIRFTLDDDSGGQCIIDSDIIEPNRWQHIVLTYDGSSNASGMNIYVNGRRSNSTIAVDTLSSTIVSGDSFFIGSRSGTLFLWNGMITDLRIHNAELTAAQMQDLYFRNIAASVEAYWPFTDGTGTTLTATTGGIDGTITSATWSTNAPFTRKLAERSVPYSTLMVDATNSSIASATSASFDTAALTLASWINPTIVDSKFAGLIGVNDGTTNNRVVLMATATGGGNIKYFDNNNSVVDFGEILTANQWTFLAITVSGSTLRLYINGELKNETTLGSSLPTGMDRLTLGNSASAGEALDGFITDARFWDSALTAAQISDLYYNQVTASPLVEYKFTDGAGTTLTDTGSLGVDGTLAAGVNWSANTPFRRRLAERDFPYSLTDTRTSGAQVSCGDNLDKEYTDSFSYSMWCYIASGSSTQGLIAKRNSGGQFTGWSVRTASGKINLIVRGTAAGNLINMDTTDDYPLKKWFLLTVVVTGSANLDAADIIVYFDGIVQDITVTTDTFDNTSTLNTGDLLFGYDGVTAANTLDGFMTDIRIHNAALTQSQIDDLYYYNIAASVEAYWPFTDGTGSTLTETVGAVNGTITTLTWDTNTPF